MIFAGKDGGNKETGGEDLLKVQRGKLEQFEIRTCIFKVFFSHLNYDKQILL